MPSTTNEQPPPGSLHPWDIMPGETAKAYAAFAIYRDMGPGRGLEALARLLHTSKTNQAAWSAKNRWQERVRAYDEHVAKRTTAAAMEDAVAVNLRHAQLGRVLQTRGAQRMASIDPSALTPGEAIQAAKVGTQIERDALGMSNKVEVTGEGGAPLTIAIVRADLDDL